MRVPRLVLAIAAVHFLGPGLPQAGAQDLDLNEIFSNDPFYKEHGILRAGGDVAFVADAWALPGPADSVSVLLGVSLSNEALQFVRTSGGQWQANYEVITAFDADDDRPVPTEKRWEKSVEVGSFDETLVTGETIVFQTEIRALPGTYDLTVTVRDRNAEDTSRATATLEVPSYSAGDPALSEPVLLRVYQPGATGTDYVVNPSHYYATPPPDFDFVVALAGAPREASPHTLRARLVSSADAGETAATWTDTVALEGVGPTRVFGSLANVGARFGEYQLNVELVDGRGQVVASTTTPLLIAGSSGWIAENWKDALSIIRYEATGKELDILENIEGAEQRIAAWNCFWEMRDPVPTTAANEAMQDYFGRVQAANNEWKSALRPGYLSDRGRVFITLGPPDDITQRPVPSGEAPFEIWTYHRYNFQILFVDRIGFNNYQLESISTYQRELAVIERRKREILQERADECPLLAPAFE